MKKFSRLGIFALTMAIAILLILPAAQALDFKISGQLNRAFLWGDNGNENDTKFVDNENSSTRFRFTGSNTFNENWKVGFKWENQMESNSSVDSSQDISNNGDSASVNFTERHMDIYVEHSMFGKLSLGQGDTASNSTSEVDLSGVDVIGYSSVSDMAGAFSFRDDDDNPILSQTGAITRIGSVYSNFDGFSRRDRVRYDTPTFYGFYASASYMNGQSWDVAGRFAWEWEGFGKLAAAAHYTGAETNRDPYTQYSGSASFLHSSGISLTAAYGARDYDDDPIRGDDDAYSYYAKVGYQIGKWAFGVDYSFNDQIQQNADEATSIGALAVWNTWESVQFYGGYRYHDLDRDNLNPLGNTDDAEDIHAVMIGARVKF